MKKHKWTVEKIKLEALKYDTRSKFQKGNQTAYQTARHLNVLDEVCAHMVGGYRRWTFEKLRLKALKFGTRGAFQKGDPSAYQTARGLGILNEICAHM